MKHPFPGMCVAVLSAAVALPCAAQANPWNGSWKMDTATVQYDGPTFSVVTDSEGFTVSMGGVDNPKMVCDGKPHVGSDGVSMTCLKKAGGYSIETTQDGKLLRKTTIALSADGKKLTRAAEIFPPQGKPYTMTLPAKRVSGGAGIAGTWKQMNVLESQDTGVLSIAVSGDSVAFKETDQDTPTTCKLDGTPTTFPDGSAMAVKLEGPHTLKVIYSRDGKVRRENTFVLSLDGKVISETDFTPDPSPSATMLLLRKV